MPSNTQSRPKTIHLAIPALALLLASALFPASLSACPTAAKLIEHMIQAHGGMKAWASAPTVSWEDEFKVGEAPSGAVSRATVEQGRRRAYIDYPGSEMRLSWDGNQAWSENWMLPYPPRFMALLNYHFLNLPWLVADPGVVLSDFGPRTLPEDPTDYLTVKITYEAGTGDTPRDYYRLYVHPKTHLLRAVEYIVTYQSILPEGMTESPTNTLVYTDHAEVGGLKLPTAYTIYQGDGSVYATAEIRDWSFKRPFDEARMTKAEGATLDTSTP